MNVNAVNRLDMGVVSAVSTSKILSREIGDSHGKRSQHLGMKTFVLLGE